MDRSLADIARQLDAYRKGKISLSTLINDLEFLVEHLGLLSGEARHEFKNQWLALEEVYTIASDEERTINSSEKEIINRALDRIIKLTRTHQEGDPKPYAWDRELRELKAADFSQNALEKISRENAADFFILKSKPV